MQIIDEVEVQNLIGQFPHRFGFFLGAGASAEAGVPTARKICDEVFAKLKRPGVDDIVVRSTLKWDQPSERYVTCIEKGYPALPYRLEHFRNSLRGIQPSFAHFALALLMESGAVGRTCLTVNFDKLLEKAFVQLGLDCQAIRSEDEHRFWEDRPDRNFVIKLHGDVDTHNILNTSREVLLMNDKKRTFVRTLLHQRGLVVVGCAGNEKSIHTLFDHLVEEGHDAGVLAFGLLWGVYMSKRPSEYPSQDEWEKAFRAKIAESVSHDVRRLLDVSPADRMFRFFPVYGAGSFFYDLLRNLPDPRLMQRARRFLDTNLRVADVFAASKKSQKALDEQLARLRARRVVEPRPFSDDDGIAATKAIGTRPTVLRVVYGDITDSRLLALAEHRPAAIVSPDDTTLSAGSGAAYALLSAAGPQLVAHELSKMAPIPQGAVVVTSAGDLPVRYIFHAAASRIEESGALAVDLDAIHATVGRSLQLVRALAIEELFIPLLGTGVGGLPHDSVLAAIATAARDDAAGAGGAFAITVVISKEKHLSRDRISGFLANL